MLECDRIEVSKGINVNKIDGLRDCINCHNWYFLDINFKYQPKVYNGYPDLIQQAICMLMMLLLLMLKEMRIRDFSFEYMSKDKAIILLRNPDLTEAEHYKT